MYHYTMSEWHPIPGFPHYEVTKDGRVRSVDRTITDSLGRVCRKKGRLIKPAISGETKTQPGYPAVSLGGGNKNKKTIHSIMAETFLGPSKGRQVRHLNGNSKDNRLENLAYDETGKQNMQDAIRHGTNKEVRKTHCIRGHKLEDPNLVASYLHRGRNCLACRRARAVKKNHPGLTIQEISDAKYREIIK